MTRPAHLVVSVLMTHLLVASLSAAPLPYATGDAVSVESASASVMIGATAVATVSKGDRLEIEGLSGEWLQVQAGGQLGWIRQADVVRATARPVKELQDERGRLFQQFKQQTEAKQMAEAVSTAEKITPLDRKILARAERDVPDRRELIEGFRKRLDETLFWLAGQYFIRNDLALALERRGELVPLRVKRFGEGHWQTIDARIDLARVEALSKLPAERLGQWRQAKELHRQAEQHQRKAEFADANVAAERALAMLENVLGKQHSDYAITLNLLANLQETKTDYARAESLYQAALAIRKATLGEAHPAYAQSLDNLAGLQRRRGHIAIAEKLTLQALAIRKEAYGERHTEYAVSLVNLGDSYSAQGKPSQAEPLYQQALEIRKSALGEQHALYAESLNKLGGVLVAQGAYSKSVPLFQQALEIRKSTLGERHTLYAQSLTFLADAHATQAAHAKAEPLHRQAAEIRKAVLGDRHPVYAESLNRLGSTKRMQGQHAEAERLHQQALEIVKSVQGEKHPDYTNTLNLLALVYEAQGHNSQAESLFRQALELRKSVLGDRHPLYAQSLKNLGSVCFLQGDFVRAEQFHEQSLAVRKAALGEQHADYADSLNALAVVYEAQGRRDQAERAYLQALEVRKAAFGERHPLYGLSLHNLAWIYNAKGAFDKAESLFRQALDINRSALGENNVSLAMYLSSLGANYVSQHNYAQAEPLYQQALELRKTALGEQHAEYAKGLNLMAVLHERQGDLVRAEPLYRQALEIRRAALGERHPHFAQSLDNLGFLLAGLPHWADAIEPLHEARRVTRRHMMRVLPGLSEKEQLTFIKSRAEPAYYRALSFGLSHSTDPLVAARSAEWLLNGKAVVQESLAERVRLVRDARDPKVAKLATELKDVRGRLAKVTLMTPASEERQAHRAKLTELSGLERELTTQIGQATGEARDADPWVELSKVRELLPAESLLIEVARFHPFQFGAQKTWQPPRYAAWLVPQSRQVPVRVVDLGPAQQIDAAVMAFQKTMQAAGSQILDVGEAEAETEARRKLEAISTLILRPLEKHFAGHKRLLISPDASLWLAPWEALPLADGRYALEEYPITYLVSGRDLVTQARHNDQPKQAGLIVADPDFELATSGASQTPRATHRGASSSSDLLATNWPRLIGTAQEASAILPKLMTFLGSRPTLYTRQQAVEATVKQVKSPQTMILSTHGYFQEDQAVQLKDQGEGRDDDEARPLRIDNPLLRCGLVFAGANRRHELGSDSGDDGILTGLEIAEIDLRGTQMVVLSACETGLGQARNGEGVAGLRQAFQLAGARSVVSSLWKVPDAETARLMSGFWDNLARGQHKTDALREAQLAVLRARRASGEKAAHPWFWAAFTLTGM